MWGLKTIRFPPVFVAASVQLTMFLFLVSLETLTEFLEYYFFNVSYVLPLASFVLIQSCFAAILTYKTGMARWWCWIQFLLPLAVLFALSWQLPPFVFLLAFVVSMSLFWTTFKTQVPFYPSHSAVMPQVLALLPPEGRSAARVLEIGSGLGSMSLFLAQHRPDVMVEGIENAPLPWLVSKLRGLRAKSSVIFHFGDYHRANFMPYDLVFAYLSPAAMTALWEKCTREMRSGSLLVSYEFDIPGAEPSQVIVLPDTMLPIYVWRFP